MVYTRRLSKLQWAKLAWRCGKEMRRREGLIQTSREDLAQLALELAEREGVKQGEGGEALPLELGEREGAGGRRLIDRTRMPHQEWQ